MHIFEGKTAEEDEDTMYDVRVSYIEIYNEEIRLSYFYIFPYVLSFSFISRSTMRGLVQFYSHDRHLLYHGLLALQLNIVFLLNIVSCLVNKRMSVMCMYIL